ncbi:DUF6584 family protein [Oleiharenicola lentus]|uniref:DUF6584 family protein n=1 Tax=Oleiharenicola lentus TaxID=2508720 RepID=UPI003F67C116
MKIAKLSSLDRASAAVTSGKLWRAKEILAGHIGSTGYTPELFAAYGKVLAQMNDSKEAGKYLLLSGLENDEDKAAIELYVSSVREKPYTWIRSQFPSSARNLSSEKYPQSVYSQLRELGFPEHLAGRQEKTPFAKSSKWKEGAAIILGFTILGLIVVGLLHGLYVVGKWLFT